MAPSADDTRATLAMRRALELAARAQGHVSPNPMVGCVIVHQGEVIGEGWHAHYGGPHAEVNALRAVADPDRLPQATLYVTLEPCSHFGKTPPCADLLIEKRVGRVVIACTDPNPLVSGRGIAKLRAAGIPTEVGLLEAEARWLNRRFFTALRHQRPYLILKWAQTADGFLARPDYNARWISGTLARQLVHRWRTEEDAILVGRETALRDNPRLTARDWEGRSPVRVVLDRRATLPADLHLFDGPPPTLRYCVGAPEQFKDAFSVPIAPDTDFLTGVWADLYQRGLHAVLIEGGSAVLHSLLAAGHYDEIRRFVSPQRFGAGIAAPLLANHPNVRQPVGDDELAIFYRNDNPT